MARKSEDNTIARGEFIALMALLMSLVALAIDAMLPALDQIGASLAVVEPNATQLVISAVFLGMSLGLMLYGPLSDSFGRKPAIYLGVGLFLLGDLISIFAGSFGWMLVGRLCQGFGAAACRVVTLAMIRDRFAGREMARVMSLIMMCFILVPALAPTLGQAVLWVSDWRGIFWLLFAVGLCGLLWLGVRQPETLAVDKRLAFTPATILSGMRETLFEPHSRFYIAASGLVFGAFIGYLSSAQQILQSLYRLGDAFPLYFGALALAIGASSWLNARLVMRFSLAHLCLAAVTVLSLTALGFLIYLLYSGIQPPLALLMGYLAITFCCFGLLFGNLNTLAVQPLGHIAGVATSVISSIQTLMSVLVGALIGQAYDGTVVPLVIGFALCGGMALAILLYLRRVPAAH